MASGQRLRTLEGHRGAVYSVAFSPDGRTLAAGGGRVYPGAPGNVILWDAASGQRLCALEGHRATVWSVAFSPDGRILASGSQDGTVVLWGVPREGQ